MTKPKMVIELPDLDKMPNVNKREVLEYINKRSMFDAIITYAINWWYKNKRVRLQEWIKEHIEIDDEIKERLKYINKYKSNREKILEILRFVIATIKYETDIILYGTNEYWATPSETWELKKGDCEDMAILIYAIAHYFGVPDYQMFVVAGNVEGGGHAYVIFLDNNGIEYPIDAAYWPRKSLQMIPYVQRADYFYGGHEWFRFNVSGSYIVTRY